MRDDTQSPIDIAKRIARRRDAAGGTRLARGPVPENGQSSWRREAFVLPRDAAREKAQEWFALFPKAAYMTEVEFWRELPDGQIEFTMRRLPTAD
jgi:hypothetical protein